MELGTAIQWMKKQPKYRGTFMKLMKHFEYKGISCVGMITRTHYMGQLTEKLHIRPLQSTDDIGEGIGQSVFMEFSCK
jgi:hypothetical protein